MDLSRFGATLLIIVAMAACTCAIVGELRARQQQGENTEQAEYWEQWNSIAPVAHEADCHCDTCCYRSENN